MFIGKSAFPSTTYLLRTFRNFNIRFTTPGRPNSEYQGLAADQLSWAFRFWLTLVDGASSFRPLQKSLRGVERQRSAREKWPQMSLDLLNILPFDRFDCFDSGRPKIQSIPGNDDRLASTKIKATHDSLIRAFIYMGQVGLDKNVCNRCLSLSTRAGYLAADATKHWIWNESGQMLKTKFYRAPIYTKVSFGFQNLWKLRTWKRFLCRISVYCQERFEGLPFYRR